MSETILVVDDFKEILQVLKRQLEQQSFVVLLADNASEAVMISVESHPDLIITDVEMPGLNGLALCRLLKRNPDTRSIPIVIMSGVGMKVSDFLMGYESGAIDYVTKPISMPL